MTVRRMLCPAIASIALLCAACATTEPQEAPPPTPSVAPAKPRGETPKPPAPVVSKGAQDLAEGVRSYENGAYKNAAKQLQKALDSGLDAAAEQTSAHKYLAFMHCAAGRKTACRKEFRMSFAADPNFSLEPGEAGHPVWGPVFRQVKSELAKEAAKK